MDNKITVTATINADYEKSLGLLHQPKTHCKLEFCRPKLALSHKHTNDMKVGGIYKARMEAKDGSFGFDFEANYTQIEEGKNFSYEFGGRQASVDFKEQNGQTEVTVSFDPETQNPAEMQRQGWQAILNNFKKYTEYN
jgi:uncharacterized protein YndB with AHSA1/START domain